MSFFTPGFWICLAAGACMTAQGVFSGPPGLGLSLSGLGFLRFLTASLSAKRAQTWLLSRDSVRGAWHSEVLLADSAAPDDWAPDGSGVLCRAGSWLMLVSPQKRVLWRRDIRAMSHLDEWGPVTYSRDGRMLYTIGSHPDGRWGVWAFPVSGGKARLVVLVADPFLSVPSNAGLSIGRDRLYLTVSEYESDIWVAKLKW